MKEYIEREAFYRFLTEQKDKETGAYSKGRNAGLDVARSALHNREITPAADVVDRKRGRRKKGAWRSKCSQCGFYGSVFDADFGSFNFCGADMREVDHGNTV